MDYEEQEIKKARSLANWSFVGLFIPIAGWILAGIASSSVKHIHPKDRIMEREIKRVKSRVHTSVSLSIIICAIGVGLSIWGVNILNEQIRQEQAAQKQTELEQSQRASEEYRQNNLQKQLLSSCLDNANTWYSDNVKNVTTVYQEQNLLTQKQQYMNDCQLRYAQ